MSILITMPNGISLLIDVQLEITTVYDVKKKLMEKIGINVDEQILLFNGDVLRNDKILQQYGIEQLANLQSETTESLFKTYKDLIESYKEDLNNCQAERSENQQFVQYLQQQLRDLQVENNQLLQKNNSLEAELQKYKDSQELKNKNYELQIKQIKLQLQRKQEESKKLETDNMKIRDQLYQQDLEREKLESQVIFFEKEKQLQFSSSDYKLQQQNFMEVMQEKRENFRTIQKINQLSEDKSNEIMLLKQFIKQHESEIEDLKNYNKLLLEDKIIYQTQSREHLKEKNNEFEKQQQIYEKRIEFFKSQIKNLEAKNDEMNNLKSNSNENDEEILSYKRKIAKLESEYKEIQIQLENSQIKLFDTKKKLYEKQKNLDKSEESKNKLESLMKDKDCELKLNNISIEQLEEQIHKYRQSYNKLLIVAQQMDSNKFMQFDIEKSKLEENITAYKERSIEDQKQFELKKKAANEKIQLKLKEEQQEFQQQILQGKEKRLKTAKFSILVQQQFQKHK